MRKAWTYQDGMSKPGSQRKGCGKEEIQQKTTKE